MLKKTGATTMRTLYDLAGADDRLRFSPFCFRVKLALHIKQLEYQPELVRFTEKEKLAFSNQNFVPVLRDGETVIADSWKILQYLDHQYPQTTALFEPAAAASVNFIRQWCDKSLHTALFFVALPFVHANLAEKDQAYFRETREKRVGKTLEVVASERGLHMAALQRTVEPLRATLADQAYLAGDAPGLADLLVLSAFMWAMSVVPFALFESDDVINAWIIRTKQIWAWA
jgi:glutathione S-transferase